MAAWFLLRQQKAKPKVKKDKLAPEIQALLNKAEACRDGGQYAQAEGHYRAALALSSKAYAKLLRNSVSVG